MKKLEGFKKIGHRGGSFVKVEMWNPETKEFKAICVRDYEYSDMYGMGLSAYNEDFTPDEKDELYYMDIDEDALNDYNFEHSIPYVGCEVEVVKGRKYSHGDRGRVVKMYDYKDKYGRFIAKYIITDNGMKINKDNVKVVGR